ncbi:MAG: hypothetical protein KY469_09265 [Actinobacteria bacterium]|nr:hypothetical protein [Actinomycetota bacterium]
MSATTAPNAAGVASPGTATTPTAAGRLRRGTAPVALAVGSVAAIAGMALHAEGLPDEAFVRTIESQPGQWLASHLALGLGMALVALGITSVLRLVEGRQAKAVVVGTMVAAVGAALMSLGDLAHGVVAFALAGHVDAAASLAAQEAYFAQPAIMILSMAGMLLPLGLVILGVGLFRAQVVPRWLAAVVLVSPIAVQAGMASGPRMLAFGLPFVVAMGALARETARA